MNFKSPNETTSESNGPAKGISRDAFTATRPRRFYKAASLDVEGGTFRVALDGRLAKTPSKRLLALPTRDLAEALVAEWNAQGKEILAETMPLTRLANTIVDGVIGNEAAVRDDIVAFAGSDLACYRAAAPEGLVEAQSREWDPVLAWARDELGANFQTAIGILHVAQPQAATECVSRALDGLNAWQLTALHQMTTLTGSALIAIACFKGAITVEEAWRAAHVDEDWQISQWGDDDEAMARREQRWRDMQAADRLLGLLGN